MTSNNRIFFQTNQEVIITKNLGTRFCRGENHYYYGGTVDEVPLGTRARIRKIKYESIMLELESEQGRRWWIHPDELDTI